MPPRKKASRDYHYLNVLSEGPLMIVRVPWPMPRWKDILKALTVVMQSHGLKKKDIYSIESTTYFGPASTDEEKEWYPKSVKKDDALLVQLNAAFAGDAAIVPEFWLYQWGGDKFSLVREGK